MSADILRFPTPPSRLALRLEWFGSNRSVLTMIWALYFALRVAVLLAGVAPTGDAAAYYGLAAGTGPAALQAASLPPGWPLALSLVFAQFGASPVTLGLFNLASAMLAGLLTLALGRRLFRSEAAARAGLLLLAVYPQAIGYVPLALPEVFTGMLLLAGCWTVITRTRRWQLVTAGLIFGLAALTNPQTLIAVPLLFAVEGAGTKDLRRHTLRLLGDGLLVLGVALLITLPWLPGHYQAFVPPAGSGYTLTERLIRLWDADGEMTRAYLAGAPGLAPLEAAYPAVHYAALTFRTALMLAFAAAFLVMLVKRRRNGQTWAGWWLLPYGIALCPVLAVLAFPGRPELHVPVMPFVCMSAGWLAVTGWNALAERGRPAPTLH
ncbi:glycosyltransferase family 39 protein [Novosphingobium beihaiensis]|uniref:Glycosyltransferase family 39 protein n=1 Tax=Novosphingobium beihaiensis TaxID=2930389 RepID=A0ABT0BQL5_9SPHN|nr:glycosyltransferase family 39 protein [Novosphingobium beihaiensis]MCJ2187096.1 glycosyltransferase family 39 protein [Novosphingobium beihaiensis]